MRTGQQVEYRLRDEVLEARVVGIAGAGPSTAKILDLEVDGTRVEGVRHARDAAPGESHWLPPGTPRPARKPARRRR